MARAFERKKDESEEAFEAFVAYRDMGPGRNLADVANELGKTAVLIGRWSSAHSWVKRAHAYDAEVDRRKLLVDLREVEEMRKRQIKVARTMQDVGTLELEKMLAEAKRTKKKRGSLDEKTVLKLIEQGAKLERLNRGEPGEIVQSSAEPVDLSGLTLEELRALRTIQAKVKARRVTEATERDEGEDED